MNPGGGDISLLFGVGNLGQGGTGVAHAAGGGGSAHVTQPVNVRSDADTDTDTSAPIPKCPICLDDLTAPILTCTGPYSHGFHRECIEGVFVAAKTPSLYCALCESPDPASEAHVNGGVEFDAEGVGHTIVLDPERMPDDKAKCPECRVYLGSNVEALPRAIQLEAICAALLRTGLSILGCLS